MHRQHKEMGAYASVVAVVLVIVLVVHGVGFFLGAAGLVLLTSMCWIFLFSSHVRQICESLEEADDELDDYDDLRLAVERVVVDGRGIKALERWLDQHPPSGAHEQIKKARQS